MADAYASHLAQVRRQRMLALEGQRDELRWERAVYAAYHWLAHNPHGQVILDHLSGIAFRPGVPSFPMVAAVAEQDARKAELMASMRQEELWMHEGMRRLVQTIFDTILAAPAHLQEEEGITDAS